EPAAPPQRPPNGQTNHAAATSRSLALCCGPVSGNSGIALSAPKRTGPALALPADFSRSVAGRPPGGTKPDAMVRLVGTRHRSRASWRASASSEDWRTTAWQSSRRLHSLLPLRNAPHQRDAAVGLRDRQHVAAFHQLEVERGADDLHRLALAAIVE